jgi:UDP-N-acetylmuramoyl-L-alanyl-D-glutamate--2,6-diaminopimelate ligase
MRLRELLEAGDVEEADGDLDQTIGGLIYDSRAVKRGDIFFALPGTRMDGHDFARQAVQQEAAAVVLERKIALPAGSTCIRVRNVRRTMGLWAAKFFSYPSRRLLLVGVTGTNGKTTVTYLLESVFSAAGMVPGVIGTINYRYRDQTLPALQTTPESIDLQDLLAKMARFGVHSVAIEVSSHALELERVRGMEFDVALFTNLSRDHLDFHGDMEHYFLAKSRLFTDYLPASSKKKKVAVVHAADSKGGELLDKARKVGLQTLSYGRGDQWDVHPLEVEGNLEGLKGKIWLKNKEIGFSSHLIGAANLENILAVAGVGLALGLSPDVIVEGIGRLTSVPGRLEKIKNELGISVFVDYAHTPDALERVLRGLRPLVQGRLIALFGCGGDRDRGKRPLMGEISARLSDLLILTSDNPRSENALSILEEIEAGVRKIGLEKFQIADLRSQIENPNSKVQNLRLERGYLVEADRRAAIRLAFRLARADDLILIAGKGHEDYQIVGSQRLHFDDREVAREELRKKEEATGNRLRHKDRRIRLRRK